MDAYYIDLSDDPSTPVLAAVTCETALMIPEGVTWLRNGDPLIIDGHDYESVQVLENRKDSLYNSSLLIKGVTDLFGSPSFTCIISSQDGDISLNGSNIDLSGMLSGIQFPSLHKKAY